MSSNRHHYILLKCQSQLKSLCRVLVQTILSFPNNNLKHRLDYKGIALIRVRMQCLTQTLHKEIKNLITISLSNGRIKEAITWVTTKGRYNNILISSTQCSKEPSLTNHSTQ